MSSASCGVRATTSAPGRDRMLLRMRGRLGTGTERVVGRRHHVRDCSRRACLCPPATASGGLSDRRPSRSAAGDRALERDGERRADERRARPHTSQVPSGETREEKARRRPARARTRPARRARRAPCSARAAAARRDRLTSGAWTAPWRHSPMPKAPIDDAEEHGGGAPVATLPPTSDTATQQPAQRTPSSASIRMRRCPSESWRSEAARARSRRC